MSKLSAWSKTVVAHMISKILLMLVRVFKKNSYMQSAYFGQLISDANGILALMKFLNQDFTVETIEYQCIGVSPFKVKDCISDILLLLYLTCKEYPLRIKSFLIYYKAPIILNKLCTLFPDLKVISLKFYKVMIKYLPKKWKEKNMAIVNTIYEKLNVKPTDDWLGNVEPTQSDADEQKNKITQFNNINYIKKKATVAIITIDQWISQHQAETEPTQQQKDSYEKWLQEEVFDAM